MRTSRPIEVQGRFLGVAVTDATQQAWNAGLATAVCTGVARAARDWTIGFLHRRAPANLGAPLAADAGQPPAPPESGALKVVLAENAVWAVEQCTLLAGNHAHDRAHPLERHWRDVQCVRMHAPAADAAHLAAGRAALAEGAP